MLTLSCNLDKLPHYFLSSLSHGKLALSFWSVGRGFKDFSPFLELLHWLHLLYSQNYHSGQP